MSDQRPESSASLRRTKDQGILRSAFPETPQEPASHSFEVDVFKILKNADPQLTQEAYERFLKSDVAETIQPAIRDCIEKHYAVWVMHENRKPQGA